MGVAAGRISDACRVWAMEGDMLGLSALLRGAASVVSLEAHPGYPTLGLLLPPAAPRPHAPPRLQHPHRRSPLLGAPSSAPALLVAALGVSFPGLAQWGLQSVLPKRSLPSGGAAATPQPPWIRDPLSLGPEPPLPGSGTPLLNRGCCTVRWTECHTPGLVDHPVHRGRSPPCEGTTLLCACWHSPTSSEEENNALNFLFPRQIGA